MQKYELIDEKRPDGLLRLKALRSFGDADAGELGGLVESEANLSQEGDCWVYGNAKVSGNAQVYGYARVSGNARVSGDAQVYGYARVSGNARVSGDARVYGYANVSGKARVSGDARVYGEARVYGDAQVYGDVEVHSNADISDTRHYVVFSGLGSVGRHCTLFRTKTGHLLNVGCWSGTLDELETRVRKVYGAGSDYLWAVDLLSRVAERWASESAG